MKAIIGIGNPGASYKFNRHNIGFNVIDYIAGEWDKDLELFGENYIYSKGEFNGTPYLIVKPAIFMNVSGKAVKSIMADFKLNVEQILIFHDEVNIPIGTCKLKLGGGDGGHNGIASVIYELITDKFPRVRIGIGNNFVPGKMANYVLSDFTKTEFEILASSYEYCLKMAEIFIEGGIQKMLDYNSFINQKKRPL